MSPSLKLRRDPRRWNARPSISRNTSSRTHYSARLDMRDRGALPTIGSLEDRVMVRVSVRVAFFPAPSI